MNKILIVDDDAQILGLTGAIVSELGYPVVTASKHLDALICINNEVHILITDLNIGHDDGAELLAQFRRYHSTGGALLMTGSDKQHRTGERAKDVAAKYDVPILHKPFNMSNLIAAVKSIAS